MRVALTVGLPAAAAANFALQEGCAWRGGALSAVKCFADSSPGSGTPALHFDFCGKPATFTPVFDAAAGENTASVNAGDYNLYVGGAGINRAFQQALKLQQGNGYQELHQAGLRLAVAAPGRLVELEAGGELGLAGCYTRVPDAESGSVGAAFVDVFTPASRPLSERNVAMLYVVGPKGESAMDRKEFLKAVGEMAANAIAVVYEYNELTVSTRPQLPRIEAVQWCLVSGGIYKHPATSKLDVAAATVEGMRGFANALAPLARSSLPLVRFTYDEAAFETAVAQQQSRL